MHYKGDVITRCHGQHLSFDAQLQAFRGHQRTGMLLCALFFIQATLTNISDDLPVTSTDNTKHVSLDLLLLALNWKIHVMLLPGFKLLVIMKSFGKDALHS